MSKRRMKKKAKKAKIEQFMASKKAAKRPEVVKEQKISTKQKIADFHKKHYKKLAVAPLCIALIALIMVIVQYSQTGSIFNKGISLQGGTTLTITGEYDVMASDLEEILRDKFPDEEFAVRILRNQGVVNEIVVETSYKGPAEELLQPLEGRLGKQLTDNDYSVQSVGASLSESFLGQIVRILILAFVLMAIVVFVYFRSAVPSVVVVLTAVVDMLITLAIINILGIRISTAGIAAFLMLIDYSIDMNSMLIAKILKRDSGVGIFDAIAGAFSTGITMSMAGIGAMGSAYFVTNSPIIKQIMIILVVGLIVDAFTTWVQNAALMRWVEER